MSNNDASMPPYMTYGVIGLTVLGLIATWIWGPL